MTLLYLYVQCKEMETDYGAFLLYIYLIQHFVFKLVLSQTTHVQYKLLQSVRALLIHIPLKAPCSNTNL